MNRTAERALSIISVILTGIGTILGFIFLAFYNLIKNDTEFREQFEMELLADPTFTPADVDIVFGFLDGFGWLVWIFIILAVIGFILNIIGIVNIWNNKNPKLAGILFIISGILSGVLALQSILLYIAAILCFTKKPPMEDFPSSDMNHQDSDTMRPL